MPDVLCLGEILVDWVCTTVGADLPEAVTFTKAAGGAPANTAVGLARQGVSTGFLGRVSADEFGKWLKRVLSDNNVDVSSTIEDPDAQTRMAYVVTTESGDRKLAEFSRIACADAMLRPEDLNESQFAQASIFHFGSISLIAEPSRSATENAIRLAQKHNLIVSYDPNVRLNLWPSPQRCRTAILETLHWANIAKINEDELEFLTGSRQPSSAIELREQHDISLLIVTLGSGGALICSRAGSATVPGFQVELLEATGAGDGFNSGILAGILPKLTREDRLARLNSLSMDELKEIAMRANAVGAITCTRAGAIPALPTLSELEAFLERQKNHCL